MTQSLKQTVELNVLSIKINYNNNSVIADIIGTVKLKEEDLLVKFIWNINLGISTLIITNEVCVDNNFKNALRTILLGYTNGLLHHTKIGYTFNTPENSQLER